MKKKSFKLVLLSSILISSFFSCENNDESIQTENVKTENTQTNFLNRIDNSELEKFKNDENVYYFNQKYHEYLYVLKNNDIQGMSDINKIGNVYLEKIFTKFGKEKTLEYLEELSSFDSNSGTDPVILKALGTHDGSPCTLNTNGTTYWGACSFWEGVQAYASILLNCGSIDIPGSSSQEIADYAACNQAQICKKC